MNDQASELLEKIRQQFDNCPYPRIPLELSPKGDLNALYIHNFVTPYYLRDKQVISSKGKLILDAGCGSGYKSLMLAEANPEAKIVGIDISEESVNLARQRLKYHGFENNTEFYAIPLENLPDLGMEFDYINNDEVLYLVPDIVTGLSAMKSVLKQEGIIRTNLHSSIQRFVFYNMQNLFKLMGLLDNNPGELEVELARQMMNSLKDNILHKARSWESKYENTEEWFLANYLLQGDKGFTIPEVFSALKAADLEFISMVNWQQWELLDLFKEPDNLPAFIEMGLSDISIEDRLHMFELLHPIHRLLDFWCGHPNQSHQPFVPVDEWTPADWQRVRVHLHPQMKTSAVKQEIVNCIRQLHPFEISKNLSPAGQQQSLIDSTITAGLLLPLLEECQPIQSLVERWQKLHSVNPLTLESTSQEEAFEIVTQAMTGLEKQGYLLLERSP